MLSSPPEFPQQGAYTAVPIVIGLFPRDVATLHAIAARSDSAFKNISNDFLQACLQLITRIVRFFQQLSTSGGVRRVFGRDGRSAVSTVILHCQHIDTTEIG